VADYELIRDAPVAAPALADERVRGFLRAVYGWMCVGLGLTAVTALFVAASPALVTLIATQTFADGRHLTLDARAAGLAAAVAAQAVKAPFIVVVVVAMATTALVRAAA